MPRYTTLSILLLVVLGSLGACSSGSEPASGEDPFLLNDDRKLLGNDEITAVSYSGHRLVPCSVENTPSVEQTKEDLRIMSAMGIQLLRTYNTTIYPHGERILLAIRELEQADPDFEMYVMLGAWMQCVGAFSEDADHSVEDAAHNQREIEAAIRLASEYADIIRIIAVGNEALAELVERMDFLSLHTYAFHDTYYNPALRWAPLPEEQDLSLVEQIERAVARAIGLQDAQVQAVRDYLASIGVDKEIHIGETGWASMDDSHYGPDGTHAADEYVAGLFHAAAREWTRGSSRD